MRPQREASGPVFLEPAWHSPSSAVHSLPPDPSGGGVCTSGHSQHALLSAGAGQECGFIPRTSAQFWRKKTSRSWLSDNSCGRQTRAGHVIRLWIFPGGTRSHGFKPLLVSHQLYHLGQATFSLQASVSHSMKRGCCYLFVQMFTILWFSQPLSSFLWSMDQLVALHCNCPEQPPPLFHKAQGPFCPKDSLKIAT
jgi:hypothetical protein